MIYDCFLFYNEFELLEIRLNELNDVVDKFVLAEATVTHTNQPKPLFFQQNKEKFKKFKNKIIHIVIDDTPDVNFSWIIERYQYEAIIEKLKGCRPNDIILFSPVDEIPKAKEVIAWKNEPGKQKAFSQKLSYYFLNCVEYTQGEWLGTRMYKYKDLLSYGSVYIARYSKIDVVIPDGGWHFSFMGGVKKIQKKLESHAHQEYNNSRFNTPEKIEKAIFEKKDIFDRGLKFKIVNEDFLPTYVKTHREKFKHLLISPSENRQSIFPLILDVKHVLRTIYRNLRSNALNKK